VSRQDASENVKRIREGFDAFARGDLEAVSGYLTPGFEIHDHAAPEGAVDSGPNVLMENRRRLGEAFEDVRYEIKELREAGELIAARVRVSGRGRGSGLPIEDTFGMVWTIRAGMALRLDVYPSWETALEAAEHRGRSQA
jgi:ketosteroid isomerase-like protein